MSKIKLEDLIEVVMQPDYSKQKLLDLQTRYNLDTVQFIEFVGLYKEGIPLPVDSKDMDNWLFHLKMFLASGGEILELVNDFSFDNYYDDTRIALIA